MSDEISTETQNAEEVTAEEQAGEEVVVKTSRRRRFIIIGIAALVLLVAGLGWYAYARNFESTDDAQIDGHLNPVAARIDGTIKAVYADDNQKVQAGTLLVELDASDEQVALQKAQAQYDQAMAQLGAAHPNLPITQIGNANDLTSRQAQVTGAEAALEAARADLATANARLKESQANNDRAQGDLSRYQILFDKQEVSRADYDHYKAAAAAQAQTVASNQSAVTAAQKTVEQRASQVAVQRSQLQQIQGSAPLQVAIREADIKSQKASTEVAQSELNQRRLNLSYIRIAAPVSGILTQRSAEIGAHISRGQQLFMIVQIDDLWVTANFKETQLEHIHPGQKVRIRVDALSKDFDGIVESMPAVTGARTSVLPPENATGNYVKVIQRLPVRIRINKGQADLDKLRPGMSVEPTVHLD